MSDDEDRRRLNDQARHAREWRTSRGVEPTRPYRFADVCIEERMLPPEYDVIEERILDRVYDMIDASQAHDMIADLVDALRVTLPACPHDEASAITYARGKAWLTTHRKAP